MFGYRGSLFGYRGTKTFGYRGKNTSITEQQFCLVIEFPSKTGVWLLMYYCIIYPIIWWVSTLNNGSKIALNIERVSYISESTNLSRNINSTNSLFFQDYQVDLYLRQHWEDPRLNDPAITEALDLNDPRLVQAIWKPGKSLTTLT